MEHHPAGLTDQSSTSSASVQTDSWESVGSDEDKLEAQRLAAEDMADGDELAELREIEHGGVSRRGERRR